MTITRNRAALFRPFFLLALLPFSIALAQVLLPAAVDFALSQTQVEKANIKLRTLAEIGENNNANGNAQALNLPGMVVLPLDAQEIVSVPASGMVQAILTPPSQPVRAGQPLLRLYSPQLLQ
ncbi:MAG: efflux RND transporter periplasmic adaptor subunit, partial [Betaproteobacteria bacterium]|nr:efflux RND transporter periplasmic adaptor subunit [Betaproteobacteria bacterium]